MNRYLKGLLLAVFILFGCYQQSFSQEETGLESVENLRVETGLASWYGPGLQANSTAGGEVFDMAKLTAAHPTLPFDTRVKVTNLKNKKSIIVRINDRGPFIKNRIIDLSREAARRLDMLHSGLARVKVEIVNREAAEDTRFKRSLDSIPLKRIGISPAMIRPVYSTAIPVYKLNRNFPNAASGKAASLKSSKDETD